MEMKKPWQSKTLWFNGVAAALEILQLFGPLNLMSPEMLALGMGVGNILLRLVTKQPVSLKGE